MGLATSIFLFSHISYFVYCECRIWEAMVQTWGSSQAIEVCIHIGEQGLSPQTPRDCPLNLRSIHPHIERKRKQWSELRLICGVS